MKTLIRGGTIVVPGGTVEGSLLFKDGRIAGIIDSDETIAADVVIDATGMVVLPGAIDGHTHFVQDDPKVGRTPYEESEGFVNGGRAAAAGGITCVVEMPQATPPTLDGRSLRRRKELATDETIVDFALWGGVCAGQPGAALDEQIAEGAVAFKAFMCDSDPTFPGVNDDQIFLTLQHLAGTPFMFGLHAESDALLQAGLLRMRDSGRTDPMAHHDSRPPIVEIEAVHRAIFFAEATGGWVHFVHLSTAGAAQLVKEAKTRGVRVTAETCPQYLALDHQDLIDRKGFAKCAPAIRSRGEVERLWEYVIDGSIDCITSDHCGFTVESKLRGESNIWLAPNGLSGVQTLLPVVITEGLRRGLTWNRIAALTATTPASLWKLSPRKGSIEVGADADVAIVNPETSWTVSEDELMHSHAWSPFTGRKLTGRIVQTIVRGVTVFSDHDCRKVLVEPGFGEFVSAIV
jgi:allantoinase